MGDTIENPESQDSSSKNPTGWSRSLWFLTSWPSRWATLALIVGVLAIGVWGLGFGLPRQDEIWERIQAQGLLTIATDASYPPFSAVDEFGNLFGFEIDLAEEIGRRWGVRVEFENITYDALLATLISQRDDAVISAFVPQPGRMKEISFTRSYFVGGTVAVVRTAEWDERPLAEAWEQWASGKTVAVEYGAGGDALARQWARRVVGLTILPKPTASEALAAVENGEAEAALVDAISAYDFLLGHPMLALAGPPLEPEPYTIAVNADSHILFQQLESVLQAMEDDGTLSALRVKWFGEAAVSGQ